MDFFSKSDQICKKLQIWSHLLKTPLMKNFIFFVTWAGLGYIPVHKFAFICCTVGQESSNNDINSIDSNTNDTILIIMQ